MTVIDEKEYETAQRAVDDVTQSVKELHGAFGTAHESVTKATEAVSVLQSGLNKAGEQFDKTTTKSVQFASRLFNVTTAWRASKLISGEISTILGDIRQRMSDIQNVNDVFQLRYGEQSVGVLKELDATLQHFGLSQHQANEAEKLFSIYDDPVRLKRRIADVLALADANGKLGDPEYVKHVQELYNRFNNTTLPIKGKRIQGTLRELQIPEATFQKAYQQVTGLKYSIADIYKKGIQGRVLADVISQTNLLREKVDSFPALDLKVQVDAAKNPLVQIQQIENAWTNLEEKIGQSPVFIGALKQGVAFLEDVALKLGLTPDTRHTESKTLEGQIQLSPAEQEAEDNAINADDASGLSSTEIQRGIDQRAEQRRLATLNGHRTDYTPAYKGVDDPLVSLWDRVTGTSVINENELKIKAAAQRLGSSLTEGMSLGIRNNQVVVLDAMGNLLGDLESFAHSHPAIDAHSPSKAYAKLGMTIPRGLAQGIAAGADTVRDAVDDMLPGIVRPSGSSSSAGSGTVNITITNDFSGVSVHGKEGAEALMKQFELQTERTVRQVLSRVQLQSGGSP